MNDNNSGGKIPFASFHSIKLKGNWLKLVEKNSRPGTDIMAIFRLILFS